MLPEEADMVKLITIAEVTKLVRAGKSTIYNQIRLRKFPGPIRPVGGKVSRFDEAEILAHIEQRRADRDTAEQTPKRGRK
jgi:predicted DNA-binding transcriptional regulator AlpA